MDEFHSSLSFDELADAIGKPTPRQQRKLVSLVLLHMLTFVHRSFMQRAKGRKDNFSSPRWKPLSKSRKRYKARKRPGTERTINIFTGKLVTSFKPGRIRGNTYYPNSRFQAVRIGDNYASFTTRVPYAKHVNKVRRLLPQDMNKVVEKSSNLAMRDFLKGLK